MQTNIFSLIEELVSMSGSNNNFDTLDSELTIINSEIPRLESELAELTSSMVEEKYFDASQEIVDRNIEISVSKKLSKLEKEYDDLKEKIDKLEKEEQKHFETIDSLKQKIIKTKKNLNLVDERINNSESDETKTLYSSLFEEEQSKITELQNELELKNKALDKLNREIASLDDLNQKTKKLIEQAMSRLLEVRRSLSNKNSYVDENLKHRDNDKLKELSTRLEELKNKRTSIINDASFLSNEIKELIISKENEKSLKKLSQLVSTIKEKPYMDIADKNSLNEELGKLEEQQREFLIAIENKTYYGEDVEFIESRINHLENINKVKNAGIKELKDEIQRIDNDLVLEVSKELKRAENKADELEKAIEEANNMLNEDNKKSSSVVASLKATTTRKTTELKIINDFIQKYINELNLLIEESSYIENVKIKSIKETIDANIKEIEELKKLKLMSTKSKDTIEQELDKKEIKKLAEEIKNIKHRLSFDKNPDEIYDEIEMILTSENVDSTAAVQSEEVKEEPKIEITDVSLEPSKEKLESTSNLKNDETIPLNIALEKENQSEQVPLFEDIEEPLNINISTNESAEDKEQEYTLSELEDTAYFSLEEFLKSLENQKEE